MTAANFAVRATAALCALLLVGAASPATAAEPDEAPEPTESIEAPAEPAPEDAAVPEQAGPAEEAPAPEQAAAAGSGGAALAAALPAGTHRLYGKSRYDTAVAVSAFAHPGGAQTVVLVSGQDFPDATSAAPLAAALDAPLLLTTAASLPAAVKNEITRLAPDRVIVVGGRGAVGAGVASGLERSGIAVTRISGADRFQTSAAVARFGWPSGASDVFIATGAGYADALSIAPAAAKLGGPVLLVPKAGGAPLEASKQLLAQLGADRLHIAGGTGAVSQSVQNALAVNGRTATRYSGKDRFGTSAAILQAHFAGSAASLFWASGSDFPDALAGAAAAGASGSALALSGVQCVPTAIYAQTSTLTGATRVTLGGPTVLSDSVRDGLSCFESSPAPTISGSAKVGSTLTANPRTWIPAPTGFGYQWRRDGANISGATGASYQVVAADLGKQLSVVVTGSLQGYATVKVASAASRVVFNDQSINSPSSITVVVNKKRPLSPAGFAPSDLRYPQGIVNVNGQPLRSAAATALERMHGAARSAGLTFTLQSGYRSYSLQSSIYNGYVSREGRASADTHSARPGYSEHQTGLAIDLNDGGGCALQTCFENTAASRWLKANAYRFGFILRYDAGLQPTVGFTYEPWHYRYVGEKVSRDMKAKGIRTLEDYYGLPKAPSY